VRTPAPAPIEFLPKPISLLGNHLLANAKALVFAGTYFAGDEANAWLQRGVGLLREQVAEQVLADGGHFERSPMYHAIVLELRITKPRDTVAQAPSPAFGDTVAQAPSPAGGRCRRGRLRYESDLQVVMQ
jgi:Heparinase II/III N-terminus